MNQIKFFKHCTKIGVYYDRGKLNEVLGKLALFLSTEVTCFGSASWIRFLNTTEEDDETSGNLMDVEKKGNNVYISDLYYDGPENERKYFIISISELIKLMNQWEKLMKEKPEEIILSEHNGKFELVGKNNSR